MWLTPFEISDINIFFSDVSISLLGVLFFGIVIYVSRNTSPKASIIAAVFLAFNVIILSTAIIFYFQDSRLLKDGDYSIIEGKPIDIDKGHWQTTFKVDEVKFLLGNTGVGVEPPYELTENLTRAKNVRIFYKRISKGEWNHRNKILQMDFYYRGK